MGVVDTREMINQSESVTLLEVHRDLLHLFEKSSDKAVLEKNNPGNV